MVLLNVGRLFGERDDSGYSANIQLWIVRCCLYHAMRIGIKPNDAR